MDWFLFVIFFCACAAAASTGAMFLPDQWYRTLTKPWWTPPDWVFPVTWTVLYLLIAAAAARASTFPGSQYALAFWAVQIAVNGLWSPVFFGLRRIKAGMIVVGALWLSVLGTLVMLFQLDTIAGAMFVPYLIWVTIAASLNLSILLNNPDTAGQTA